MPSRRVAVPGLLALACGAAPADRLPAVAIGEAADESDRADGTEPGAGSVPRSDARLGVGVAGARHLGYDFPELVRLYGLAAAAVTPEWSAPATRPEAARDDDLLTAWSCAPRRDAPCVLGLSFAEPVELRALRIYAAAGPDWRSYSSHPRPELVRIHTDAGAAQATIDDGAGHRYVVFDAPVRTRSVALEIVRTQGGEGGPIQVAELEAIGGAGPMRAPLDLDPERAYVAYVNSDWKRQESGDYLVRQAFLEFARPDQAPLRFMRATAMFGRSGDRFVLLERIYRTDCDYHGGSYVLIDRERRMYYPLGPMGGVPGEVFRHRDGFGFAIGHDDLRDLRSAVFTGTDVEWRDFPKRSRDRPTDYLDAWGMDGSPLTRGGVAVPPANCAPLDPAARASLAAPVAAGEGDELQRCELARGAVIIARTGMAVVDDEGAVVAASVFERPGPAAPRLRTVGLRGDAPGGELFVETRDKSGARRLYWATPAGVTTLAEDTALALHPPDACGRAEGFRSVRARPDSDAEGADGDDG